MSSLRLRFRFNHQAGGAAAPKTGGTKGAQNFSRVIVEDIAFTYSEHLLEKLKGDIEKRMHGDIDRELEHMARMFMSGVVGVAGRNRGPTGVLNPVAPISEAMGRTPLMSGVPVRTLSKDWARREPFYLAGRGGNPPWFHRHGGPLQRLRSAKTWTNAFGGISITVENLRSSNATPAGFDRVLGGTKGGLAMKFGVANIRVEAMHRITTGMLPALGGGGLGDFGASPRSSGLLALLGERTAWRLGGNPMTVPFRPTVQPFLSYFLTRQLPNAVFKRIEQGLGGKLNDQTGSAGRTR